MRLLQAPRPKWTMIATSRGDPIASGENHPLTLVRLAPRHASNDCAHPESAAGDHARAKARSARLAILALVAAFSVLVLAGTARTAPNEQRHHTIALTSFDYGILAQLNHVRRDHGLPPLHLSMRLSESADAHSREMGTDGYFAHASFDGTTYWKRIQQWYPWTGYEIWSVGENLLWSSPDLSAATALKLWMQSSEHRANILNPNWREIGISAVHSEGAPGAFGGQPVTIITTDFGVRGA
jgi:uncharacterized protein YkwD